MLKYLEIGVANLRWMALTTFTHEGEFKAGMWRERAGRGLEQKQALM